TGSGGGGGGSGSRKTPLPLYRDEVSNSLPPEFEKLTNKIGIQIFKINSNVTAIQKLVSLSSSSNTSAKAAAQDWSKRINDLIETTRELVKDATTDIKQLSTFPLGPANGAAKLTQGKLQRDFQAAALQFQRVQKEAVATTRAKLEQDKQKERQMLKSRNSQQLLIDAEESDRASATGAEGGLQAEALDLLPEGPTQADLEYQESLITSREAEIREIESGVQELNEIFRDLGNIVQEQGGMIDNIEFNINSIAENTAGA
ncbi:hypothetical protein, partial [Sporisorium scitamineum]